MRKETNMDNQRGKLDINERQSAIENNSTDVLLTDNDSQVPNDSTGIQQVPCNLKGTVYNSGYQIIDLWTDISLTISK